jgi:hypothetical protein
MEENEDVKCGKCKSYKYPTQFLKNGKRLKTCDDCRKKDRESRERKKYEHGKIRSQCKDCGGSSICEHGKIRSQCKDCGGSSICEHGKIRSQCKDCGGSSICEHGKIRSTCKDCDFSGYLGSIVRSRVYQALKHDKELSSKEYLGCDMETLKKHIEQQFTEGMTWDNYGEWHIDHITPLKYNNPSLEEVIERLHYTNTQPLWAEDNLSKGNRRDDGVLEEFIF